MMHTDKKRLQKNASSDFLSKKKYKLFRKQFDHLHVSEKYLDIFVIDDEDEIEIIEDEEEEISFISHSEEEDDEEEVDEEEEEIGFISDEEEEDDEEEDDEEEDDEDDRKDEYEKFREFTDKIAEFMDRIKDVNFFDRQSEIINHFLNYILMKCKPQNKLRMASISKLKAMILSYHPDKNVENE